MMVAHCISIFKKDPATAGKAERLREILISKTKDMKVIDEAIGILRESKSLTYARKREDEILSAAWNEIKDDIPESKAKSKIKNLAEFLGGGRDM